MSELALQLIAENKRTKNPFLDLGNCGLNNYLPEELWDCTWLQRLNLGDFYYELGQQKWIRSKNKSFKNKFKGTELIFLEKLTQLQALYLSSNQITDIRFLEKLTQLQTLDLSNNQIKDIQFLLPHLKRGLALDFISDNYWDLNNKIGLKGNTVINPLQEIIKQGNEAIIEHFEGGNKKSLNECKLIFVGDGGVGKTSLMKRVVYNEFNDEESTTHGINKIAWKELRNEYYEPVKVNLWDFGGQHIQHSLHQFFFTERVVYVLVLNPRNDQKAHYWLEQIEKLGKESEILVVYNWKQEDDKKAPYLNNFYELRKKYPKLPEPYTNFKNWLRVFIFVG